MAATTTQLINQITSHSLLDYELLSNFFLTFRIFMTTHELVAQLIDRLGQSFSSTNDYGRITRVRAFVALRHWVLNYFVDDFLSDYVLRTQFCRLVNRLCSDLLQDGRNRQGDLKILAELKKCWKHTCALYWDMPESDIDGEFDDDEILPGGQTGSRASRFDSASHLTANHCGRSSRLDLSGSAVVKPVPEVNLHVISNYSLNPTEKLDPSLFSSMERRHDAALRQSDQSAQVFSCAIPATFWAGGRFRVKASSASRPIPIAMDTQGISTEPPGRLSRKRHHNRSGSFSDALRDDRAPLPVPKAPESGSQVSFPVAFPGALIRGALFNPAAPHVESLAPSSPVDEVSSLEFSSVEDDDSFDLNDRPSAPVTPASPGMKRFIGSVRRVLSTRQYPPRVGIDATQDRRRNSGSAGRPSPATSQRGRGPPKRKLVHGRAQVRIDMLAAEVNEMFQKAVQEMMEAQRSLPVDDAIHEERPVAHPSRSMPLLQPDQRHSGFPNASSNVNSNVTMGSRSIVIVDDTATGGMGVSDARPADKMDSLTAEQIAATGGPHDPDADAISRDQSRVQTVPIFLDSPTTNHVQTPRAAFVPPEGGSTRDIESTATGAQEQVTKTSQSVDGVTDGNLDAQTPRRFKSPHNDLVQTPTQPGINAPETLSDVSQASTNDPFNLDRPMANQLRRRPGGDLRAVDHVHDLDEHSESQPSVPNSAVNSSIAVPPRKSSINAAQALSSAQEKPQNKQEEGKPAASSSSNPVMNPSFEVEVAKLADLPDSESEVGIDAALRKLEGRAKLDDSTPTSGTPVPSPEEQEVLQTAAGRQAYTGSNVKRQRREGEVVGVSQEEPRTEDAISPVRGAGTTEVSPPTTPTPCGPRFEAQSKPVSTAMSEESYNSIPLLERGTSHPPKAKTHSSEWLHVSAPAKQKQEHGESTSQIVPEGPQSNSDNSLEVVEKSDSLLRVEGTQSRGGASSNTHRSFLLDDNQSLSSLPLTTPDDTSRDDESQAMRSFYDDDEGSVTLETPTTYVDGLQIRLPRSSRDPDLPPSDDSSSSLSSESDTPSTPIAEPQPPAENVASGPATQPEPSISGYPTRSRSVNNLEDMSSPRPRPSAPTATHLPYILAYDSVVLAQQFTLIEKDALAEIEWRDLIDLRWNQAPPKLNSWVEYLKTLGSDPHTVSIRGGVDLCIARFNIMVKWVRAEIVMTQDTGERAATIVKYIHIAQHARRLRNWATMYQITMALIGADCSRLKNTWALVSDQERDTLKTLETLIMPTRNFHNLRQEMETATADTTKSGEGGCIPFIGIYTHDLIYNAQKPPWLHATVGSKDPTPLVNFDRHHTAAMIVKNLLRLIEASSKYTFPPIPEVASRCLWVGSLNDEEITRRSRELEPMDEHRSSR